MVLLHQGVFFSQFQVSIRDSLLDLFAFERSRGPVPGVFFVSSHLQEDSERSSDEARQCEAEAAIELSKVAALSLGCHEMFNAPSDHTQSNL